MARKRKVWEQAGPTQLSPDDPGTFGGAPIKISETDEYLAAFCAARMSFQELSSIHAQKQIAGL